MCVEGRGVDRSAACGQFGAGVVVRPRCPIRLASGMDTMDTAMLQHVRSVMIESNSWVGRHGLLL